MPDRKSLLNQSSRRKFLQGVTAAGVLASLRSSNSTDCLGATSANNTPVCIFSKHLQWLGYDAMGEAAAELGFDGVALTVRPGGHVLPERAEVDMPKAVEAVRKAGIDVPMIVSSVTDPDDPQTKSVLKTASKLGIGHYRLGYIPYRDKPGILEQLAELKPKMSDLAAMNRHYRIIGCNHNHAGSYVGACLWDEWELFKGIDPDYLGFQHDSWHALREGRSATWRINTRLVAPRVKMLSAKTRPEWSDLAWVKSTDRDQEQWSSLTPDNLIWVFKLMRKHGFTGPISAHYEYPLGGPDKGSRKLEGTTKSEVFAVLRKNLVTLRELMVKADMA